LLLPLIFFKDGTYNADCYHDMVDFFMSVVDTDEYNVVHTKK